MAFSVGSIVGDIRLNLKPLSKGLAEAEKKTKVSTQAFGQADRQKFANALDRLLAQLR